MNFIETQKLVKDQKLQIIDLWNQEFPGEISLSGLNDFNEYLQGLSDKHHIILIDKTGTLKGWLLHFIRNKKRWFTMILDSSIHGQGWGSTFLEQAKKSNSELNGWVVDTNSELKQNGERYISPIRFYKKNKFNVEYETQNTVKSINVVKVVWTDD